MTPSGGGDIPQKWRAERRERRRGRRPDDKLIVLIIHPSFAEIAAGSRAERGLGRHVSVEVIRSKPRYNYTPTPAQLGDHGAGPGLYELLVADKGKIQLT